jgi:hypothetical protein
MVIIYHRLRATISIFVCFSLTFSFSIYGSFKMTCMLFVHKKKQKDANRKICEKEKTNEIKSK